MSPARWWPIAIVGVLGITVVANIAVYVAANDREAAVAEPDYYRKAVAWDTTLAEARKSEALGWRVDARLVRDARDSTSVAIDARDRDGTPLGHALVEVTAIHSRPPMRVVASHGTLDAQGLGRLPLDLERPGWWELRLRIRRGSDVFSADIHRELDVTRR